MAILLLVLLLVPLCYSSSTPLTMCMHLANDAKSATSSGAPQFNSLLDVYKKTLALDGVVGLYCGFIPSVVSIIIYRGLYFGLYDSVHSVSLVHAIA